MWHFRWTTVLPRVSHASQRLPNIILRRSFTRPSTTLAVIEGLEMSLQTREYLVVYFNCITMIQVLYSWMSVKGGAHIYFYKVHMNPAI